MPTYTDPETGQKIPSERELSPQELDAKFAENKQSPLVGTLLGAAKSTLGEARYQALTRPGAEVNRFGYSIIGKPFAEPEEYKREQVRLGKTGAERLRTDIPHGWLEHLGAASGALEPVLLSTPAGRLIFGAGLLPRAYTHDDRVADAVEGTAGAVVLGRDLFRLGKLGKRALITQSPGLRKVLASKAEQAYLETKPVLTTTQKEAEAARQAADTVRGNIKAAKQQAQVVASAAEDAANANVERAELEHRAQLEHIGELERNQRAPFKDIRDKMALTEAGPNAEATGRMLQAVEEDMTALAPRGARTVGASAKAIKLSQQSEQLLAIPEKIADEKEIYLPAKAVRKGSSASASIIRKRFSAYLKELIQGQGTVSEKAVAREMSTLGLKGLVDSDGTFIQVKSLAKFRELREINPTMKPVYGDVPFSELSKAYSRAGSIALNPREFPVSSRVAKVAYTRATNSLRNALGALAVADPELNQAWVEAQRHVRTVQRPFVQEAEKLLAHGRTARGAFKMLTADDPTTIEEYFKHASPVERRAISHSIFNELLDEHTDDAGLTNYSTLAKRWRELPRESKRLLAGFNNGAANLVMDEAVVRNRMIDEGKLVVKEARGKLSEAKAVRASIRGRGRKWLDVLDKHHEAYLDNAEDQVKLTLEALEKESKKLERLGELKVSASKEAIRKAKEGEKVIQLEKSGGMGMWRRMHYRMALVDIARGLVQTGGIGILRGIAQAAEGRLIFGRSKLVREALETSIDTPRGRELATALNVILRGFLGEPHTSGETEPDSVGKDQFRMTSSQ